MDKGLPKAIFRGSLKIGDAVLRCFVLEDGRRLLSGRTITKAMGLSGRGQGMRRFLDAKSLKPFASNELSVAIENPIVFDGGSGGNPIFGYEGPILPEICNAVLEAEEKGQLPSTQKKIAIQARILTKAFSTVGIIALIDEATGYQRVRDRDELQKILEAYIAKELLPWTKRFPDEFYKQLFRLRGWQYSPPSPAKPKYVGKLTNQLIYEKLPPGVLDELRRKNPVMEKGWRKHKHHQFLTENIGNPHLEKHLASVTTLMRISNNWREFERHFVRAFTPERPEQLSLLEKDEKVE